MKNTPPTIYWSNITPRERDAVVAEHVMGWKRIGAVTKKVIGNGYVTKPGWCQPDDWECFDNDIPKFTESWEDMGLVVEEMREQGLQISIGAKNTLVTIDPHDNDIRGYAENENDIPEAVAIAALRAREIEVII